MRKAQAKKLPLAPDPRFNDKLVTRFINNVMLDCKKSTAIKLLTKRVTSLSLNFGSGANGNFLACALRIVLYFKIPGFFIPRLVRWIHHQTRVIIFLLF